MHTRQFKSLIFNGLSISFIVSCQTNNGVIKTLSPLPCQYVQQAIAIPISFMGFGGDY